MIGGYNVKYKHYKYVPLAVMVTNIMIIRIIAMDDRAIALLSLPYPPSVSQALTPSYLFLPSSFPLFLTDSEKERYDR